MAPTTLLRSRTGERHGRVGFVELFFDLVFVFAVTQISHLLLAHPNAEQALQSAFLLAALWAVWVYTAWATNWLDVERAPTRLVLFAMMAGGLVLAAAIPEAFGERSLYFAIAYAAMQNGRNFFLVHALRDGQPNERRNFQRIQVWLLVSGACWIGGAVLEGNARLALWSVALLLEIGGPWIGFWTPWMGRSSTTDWGIDADHMAERCGLFIIIALGESVILIGATFAKTDVWEAPHLGALAAAFIGAAAMWWIYFATIAEEAHEAFAHHADPGRLARIAYTNAHIPMVAGIVLTAVGNEMVLAHPEGHTDAATAWVVVGGSGIFVLGSMWFFWVFCRTLPWSHLTGLALLAACVPIAPLIAPVWLSAATSAVLILVGAWETLATNRTHVGGGHIADT